jgi:hypothetical protein
MGAQLSRYIRDELYWVLHAPRQTGKTTFLQSWMGEINRAAAEDDGTGAVAAMSVLNAAKGCRNRKRRCRPSVTPLSNTPMNTACGSPDRNG